MIVSRIFLGLGIILLQFGEAYLLIRGLKISPKWIPWIAVAFVLFNLPLPSKIRVRVLEPIEFGEPPEAADDDAVVERCFEHVRSRMQAELSDLASTRRWPVIG